MCAAASDDHYANHDSIDGAKASGARRMILFYQEYVSGLKMSSTCRFDPTCSNYALTAFTRYGWIKGTVLALGRLARCGPWHPGGWDPVPPRKR